MNDKVKPIEELADDEDLYSMDTIIEYVESLRKVMYGENYEEMKKKYEEMKKEIDVLDPEFMPLINRAVERLKPILDNELKFTLDNDGNRKILQDMIRKRFTSMTKEERIKLFRESIKNSDKPIPVTYTKPYKWHI